MTGRDEWQQWREARIERLRRPHGTLALTGTHWLDEEPAPIVEGEPVLWSGDAKTITVTARAEHGLVFNGEPVDGTVTLYPDTAPNPSTLTVGELLLRPIERDGVAALRVYDPNAATRQNFAGVATFDYSPDWVLPATFTPYDSRRTESVLNADGVHRGLHLAGVVTFTIPDPDAGADGVGFPYTLAVEAEEDGGLTATFADATSGKSTYRFRFLGLPAPDAEGRTVVDFNRAYLPPCAFVDHYVCPVPPTGNTLPVPIEAGEQSVQTR